MNCCNVTAVFKTKTDVMTVNKGVKNKKLLDFNAPPRLNATYHKPNEPTEDGRNNHVNQNQSSRVAVAKL